MNIEKKALGVALILGAAVLWGTTGTAQAFAPLSLSSLWIGTLRLLVSSGFFLICLAFVHPAYFKLEQLRTLHLHFFLIAAIGMAVYNLAFFAGIRITSVAGGTALALGSGPIWAGILETLYSRQAPARTWWLGVGIAVFGLVMITELNSGAASWPLSGVALCLLSGLSYAVYGIATKRIIKTTPPLVSATVTFTLAALIAIISTGLFNEIPALQLRELGILLWLGVVATGLAYLLFSYGLRFVSGATGIALALMEPIAALVFAVSILGERPSMKTFVGIGILLLGLALLISSELRQKSNP